MNELTKIENATMSSLEIAELTGKQHKNVMADIRKILDEVGISSAEFSAVYKDQQLIERPCYKLPRRECDLVIAGYSAKYRLAIIDRWQELESKTQTQLVIPKNYSEALKLVYEQSLVIEDQSRRLADKDSLIRASNEASIKAGEIMVREFVISVDIIDLGEKQFYHWMRDQNYIMESREPYQNYVRLSYFTWKPTDVEHGGKFRYTLRITPRGKIWLSGKYLAWLDRYGMQH